MQHMLQDNALYVNVANTLHMRHYNDLHPCCILVYRIYVIM